MWLCPISSAGRLLYPSLSYVPQSLGYPEFFCHFQIWGIWRGVLPGSQQEDWRLLSWPCWSHESVAKPSLYPSFTSCQPSLPLELWFCPEIMPFLDLSDLFALLWRCQASLQTLFMVGNSFPKFCFLLSTHPLALSLLHAAVSTSVRSSMAILRGAHSSTQDLGLKWEPQALWAIRDIAGK